MCINLITHEIIKLLKRWAANLPTEKSMGVSATSLVCRTGLTALVIPVPVNITMRFGTMMRSIPETNIEQRVVFISGHQTNRLHRNEVPLCHNSQPPIKWQGDTESKAVDLPCRKYSNGLPGRDDIKMRMIEPSSQMSRHLNRASGMKQARRHKIRVIP